MWRSWQKTTQWKTPRLARGGSRLRFPPSAKRRQRPDRAPPLPPGQGGRILPSERRRDRLQSERLFSSRYLLGGGKRGRFWGLGTQCLLGRVSQSVWTPPLGFSVCLSIAFPEHIYICPTRFSSTHGPLPAVRTASRAATCENQALLLK